MLWSRVEVSNEHVGCKLSGLVLAQPTQGWPQIPPVVFASKTARQALQGWVHRQCLYLRQQSSVSLSWASLALATFPALCRSHSRLHSLAVTLGDAGEKDIFLVPLLFQLYLRMEAPSRTALSTPRFRATWHKKHMSSPRIACDMSPPASTKITAPLSFRTL
jgi:hypothetical protein